MWGREFGKETIGSSFLMRREVWLCIEGNECLGLVRQLAHFLPKFVHSFPFLFLGHCCSIEGQWPCDAFYRHWKRDIHGSIAAEVRIGRLGSGLRRSTEEEKRRCRSSQEPI